MWQMNNLRISEAYTWATNYISFSIIVQGQTHLKSIYLQGSSHPPETAMVGVNQRYKDENDVAWFQQGALGILCQMAT